MDRFRKLTVVAATTVLLVSGGVAAAQGAAATPASTSGRFLVQFTPGARAQGMASLNQAGAKVVLDVSHYRVAAVTMPTGRVDALRRSPGIGFVEPDPVRHLMSDQIDPNAQITPYGVTMTQADQVHANQPASKKVCIIDSGYFLGHVDLPTTNVTGTDTDVGPWAQDGLGHGTHVAGIIAALNNSTGVVGVDPGVSLHIVRVFNDNGDFYASTLMDALGNCEAAGANVVNMSLGGAEPSVLEQEAFDTAYQAGILSVAAAGNSGDTSTSYPAGYDSVVSVAAVDSTGGIADFSQANPDVELAAPGVEVLSTHPNVHQIGTLTSGPATWQGVPLIGAPLTDGITRTLVDGGLCDTSTAGVFAGDVVLCQRGSISFADKINNVAASGGVAAVIYNNNNGGVFLGVADGVTIPAIFLSTIDGAQALLSVGSAATVATGVSEPDPNGYRGLNGTSMATPHVAGIAALIWSFNPNATVGAIRDALDTSALDLGIPGRDDQYGYGLVQAQAALNALRCPSTPAGGCQDAMIEKSQIKIGKGATPSKDKLTWKWVSSGTVAAADFGDPTTTASYALCAYDQTGLVMTATTPAGGTCGTKPCWSLTSTGAKYANKALTPNGLLKISLKAGGPGAGKISVTGKGALLPVPTLPLSTPLRVRLIREDSGTCWEANYGTAVVNTPTALKASNTSTTLQPQCGTSTKCIFASSTTSTGNLGGLTGADATCASLATAAGLPGTYKAWLSTSGNDASTRLSNANVPYYLVDGTTEVANDWNGLTSGALLHAIDLDEHGISAGGQEVWTGTTTSGLASGTDCAGWTSGVSSSLADVGISSQASLQWTSAYSQFCDRTNVRLYCVQQ